MIKVPDKGYYCIFLIQHYSSELPISKVVRAKVMVEVMVKVKFLWVFQLEIYLVNLLVIH